MTIKYPDGTTVEGFLLSRHENTMRVALEDGQDVVEFIDAQGTWLGENLETVEITFEWQRRTQEAEELVESDFICTEALAAHLIELLETDSDREERRRPKHMTASQHVM
jgi:hypothetical protein